MLLVSSSNWSLGLCRIGAITATTRVTDWIQMEEFRSDKILMVVFGGHGQAELDVLSVGLSMTPHCLLFCMPLCYASPENVGPPTVVQSVHADIPV